MVCRHPARPTRLARPVRTHPGPSRQPPHPGTGGPLTSRARPWGPQVTAEQVHVCLVRPAAALTVAPMSHPMPPAKYVLETYDGHVVMHLTPLPEGPVFGSVTHQVRTTAQDTRARVAAGHGYNDCVPIAQHLTVDTSTGDPAAVVHGWTGDWALTNALSRTGRQLGLDN